MSRLTDEQLENLIKLEPNDLLMGLFTELLELRAVVREVVELRDNTEATYEDAYHAMFKQPGSRVFDRCKAALAAKEQG
jgi:hypothetical protein